MTELEKKQLECLSKKRVLDAVIELIRLLKKHEPWKDPYFAAEAKKRQGMNSGFAHVRENVPQHEKARSRDQAARSVGVSSKLVSAAKAIKEADLLYVRM